MKLAYIGQNQDSGLYPKKSGVIFFKAKLLNPKHGGFDVQSLNTDFLCKFYKEFKLMAIY